MPESARETDAAAPLACAVAEAGFASDDSWMLFVFLTSRMLEQPARRIASEPNRATLRAVMMVRL